MIVDICVLEEILETSFMFTIGPIGMTTLTEGSVLVGGCLRVKITAFSSLFNLLAYKRYIM